MSYLLWNGVHLDGLTGRQMPRVLSIFTGASLAAPHKVPGLEVGEAPTAYERGGEQAKSGGRGSSEREAEVKRHGLERLDNRDRFPSQSPPALDALGNHAATVVKGKLNACFIETTAQTRVNTCTEPSRRSPLSFGPDTCPVLKVASRRKDLIVHFDRLSTTRGFPENMQFKLASKTQI